jgi:hypothetical protein
MRIVNDDFQHSDDAHKRSHSFLLSGRKIVNNTQDEQDDSTFDICTVLM